MPGLVGGRRGASTCAASFAPALAFAAVVIHSAPASLQSNKPAAPHCHTTQVPMETLESIAGLGSAAAAAAPPLSPQRLLELLTAAVAELERQAQNMSGGGGGDEAMAAATVPLMCACQVAEPGAGAGPGRVPLPPQSADVEAALDALARVLTLSCTSSNAADLADYAPIDVAAAALSVVNALVAASPRRVAVIARQHALMLALAGALCVCRSTILVPALTAAGSILMYACTHSAAAAAWRDGESGTDLCRLTLAATRAFTAMERAGVPNVSGGRVTFEHVVCNWLVAGVTACPDADRPGLCAAMLAQSGFADVLSACIARAAAAVPAPDAPSASYLPGTGALTLVAALCSDRPLDFHFDEVQHSVGFIPNLEQPAPPPALMEQLLAASPALLERVVDVVAAGAPWYSAVAAAFGAGGAALAGPLTSRFLHLERRLWTRALAVLELVPLSALTAAAPGGIPIARLAPALLGLAEASQAVAGALPWPGLALEVAPEHVVRFNTALSAASAACLVDEAVRARGAAVPALVLDPSGGALASLVRVGVFEPPLLAGGGHEAIAPAVLRFFAPHCRARLRATRVLNVLADLSIVKQRVAALLAASPPLAAALGGSLGATASERRLPRGDAALTACVAERRAFAANVVQRLAAGAGSNAGGGATWLRGLAT